MGWWQPRTAGHHGEFHGRQPRRRRQSARAAATRPRPLPPGPIR